MCGEIDEQDRLDEELFDRFLELIGHYDISPETASGNTISSLADQKARTTYMDSLFKSALLRGINDAVSLPSGEKMDVLAGQAIVFARVAGFLAGQFPPGNDLFRTVMASLMEGYKEVERSAIN